MESPYRDIARILIIAALISCAQVFGQDDSSTGPGVAQSYADGLSAFERKDFEESVRLLRRVVQLNPQHRTAWNNLGRAYQRLDKDEEAVACFHKAIDIDAQSPYAYNNLGLSLESMGKLKDAELAFKKQIEINTNDKYAYKNLGELFIKENRPNDAIDVLLIANRNDPGNIAIIMSLAAAYNFAGQPEISRKLVDQVQQSPNLKKASGIYTPNDPVTVLVEAAGTPEEALKNSKEEIDAIHKMLAQMDVNAPTDNELQASSRLMMLWAAIGDAYFRSKELDLAEKYLKAAWSWTHSPLTADRLAQIYEQQGKKDEAIKFYAFALTKAPHIYENSRPRLEALVGGKKEAEAIIKDNLLKYLQESNFKMAVPVEHIMEGKGNYRVIFSPDGKVNAKFAYGTEGMEKMQSFVAAIPFPVSFPEETPVNIIRQSDVFCAPTKTCMAILSPMLHTPNVVTMSFIKEKAKSNPQ